MFPLTATVDAVERSPARFLLGQAALLAFGFVGFVLSTFTWALFTQLTLMMLNFPLMLLLFLQMMLPKPVGDAVMGLGALGVFGGWFVCVVWSAWFLPVASLVAVVPAHLGVWFSHGGPRAAPLGSVVAVGVVHALVVLATAVVPIAPLVGWMLAFGFVGPLVLGEGMGLFEAAAATLRAWRSRPGETLWLTLAAAGVSLVGPVVPFVGLSAAADFRLRCARRLLA